MKKLLILAGGWVLTVVGAILTPIPMPLPFPFPIGITMLLVGIAVLTTHSKTFRRGVQYIRHRNGWLCRGLDTIARHAPHVADSFVKRCGSDGRLVRGVRAATNGLVRIVTTMIARTRPIALGRRARMMARRPIA
jgi:hypothetical protein